MDKIGLNSKPIQTKIINGKEVTNAFRVKPKLPSTHPDYKIALSDKAKDLGKVMEKPISTNAPIETIKPDSDKPDLSLDIKAPSLPSVPDAPDVTDVLKTVDKMDTAKKAKAIILKKEPESVSKPAVFFIGGLRAFDFDLLEDGMKSMTEAVKPARYYSWDQKAEMIDEIKTRKNNQPVVLVGHGFGADSAVEIAQELNTLKNKFKRVDLLVTLNSIGLNNDFIPSNVLVNKNFLTADNGFLDDGPNIALNYKTTRVENFLRPESHSELDEVTDVQREIINHIDRLII